MRVLPQSLVARITASLSILAILAILGALAWTGAWRGQSEPFGELRQQPDIAGTFALTDTEGEAVRDSDFRGRTMLVYFGYSHCGDHCISALNMIGLAMSYLDGRAPDKAEQVVPLFITLDPERDDPDTLDAFLDGFDPRIRGLTGSEQQIAGAAAAFDVHYARLDPDEPGGRDPAEMEDDDYDLQFASFFYLIGPDGDFVTSVSPTAGPTRLAETLMDHVQE